MNVEIMKKEKDYIELKFIEEDPSIFYALRDVLAEDKEVSFVSVILEHPQVDNVILKLRTSKGNPIDKLMNGLKSLNQSVETLEKALF